MLTPRVVEIPHALVIAQRDWELEWPDLEDERNTVEPTMYQASLDYSHAHPELRA